MESGRVLFEEFEVWTARDVTFVLPGCYTKGTRYGGQGDNTLETTVTKNTKKTSRRMPCLCVVCELVVMNVFMKIRGNRGQGTGDGQSIRKRAGRYTPRACGGLLFDSSRIAPSIDWRKRDPGVTG